MKLAVLLLVCTQVFCSRAVSPQLQKPPLIPIPCNVSSAEAAADLSLRQINENRKDGFVFGLNQIVNAQEQFQEASGFVYYLTLDILETQCHVLSRQLWKNCPPKRDYEAVFGQCKVIFHINKPMRIAKLYNYDCTLRPANQIARGCGGCPISKPLNHTKFQDTVKQALEKYNKESSHNNYFILGKITKGAVQVIAGAAYHVEFTIQESSCNKSASAEELSVCQPLNCEFAHTGYCKSRAVAHWSTPDNLDVTISCDLFEPEAAVVAKQKHQGGHSKERTDQHEHGKKGEKHGGHSHQGHDHKDDHKHHHNHSESHEHVHHHLHPHEHHHSEGEHHHSEGEHHGPSDSLKPVGKITYLPADGESTSAPILQIRPPPPPAGGPAARPGLIRPPYIRPFPGDAASSDQCPGQVKKYEPLAKIPAEPVPVPK
ncbi:fetuin-B-like [Pelodytes ibericus]